MKRKFEDQKNILIKENKKMKEDLTTQKKQILTENSEFIGVSYNLREIYDKELKKYEEKVNFINFMELKLLLMKFVQNNLYLQKILNENAKLKSAFHKENESLLENKMKSEQALKQTLSSLLQEIERMKQVKIF